MTIVVRTGEGEFFVRGKEEFVYAGRGNDWLCGIWVYDRRGVVGE